MIYETDTFPVTIAILFLLWFFSLLLIIIKLIKDLRKLHMKKIQIRHLLVDVGIRSFLLQILTKIKNALILYLILFLSVVTFLGIALAFIGVVYLVVLIIRFFSNNWELFSNNFELMNSESRKWIPLLISIVFRLRLIMITLFEKWIGFKLRTFFQMVLYSKSFFPFWYLLLAVMVSTAAIATIFFLRRIFFVLQKVKNEPKAELNGVEVLIVFSTTLGAIFPLVFVLQKMFSYSLHFLHKIFYQIIKNRTGAGLVCGFIGAAKQGYFTYIFVVPRLSLDNFEDSFCFEHHQKRVAAITSFFAGQCLQFLFFYNLTMYQALYKPISLLMIFLGFFVFQVFWTHETIVKNWDYLYPRDKRKRVVRRVLFLQLEFIANFFMQLGPSELHLEIQKPNSIVSILFQRYLEDKVFVKMGFLGWFLGHILLIPVFLKLFQLGMIWVYPNIKYLFDSKGGGGRNKDRWDFFRDD